MIKKLSVILLVSSCGIAAAQTSQGTITVGGAIQFSAQKDQNIGVDTKITSFEFSPDVGFFVIDKLMVGIGVNASTRNQNEGNGVENKTNGFGVSPYIRYYIFTGNEKFAFFGEAGFGFGVYKYKPFNAPDQKGSTFNFNISPGFVFFPTPKWGIEFQLGLLSFTSQDPNKDSDEDKLTNFQFGIDSFSSGLGVRYYFSK